MKKIYFAGSISSGRGDVKLYKELIEHIKKQATVLTEFIGDTALSAAGESNISDREIHDRDLAWLFEADALIAEVTTASLGVGYEIGRAIEQGKKILCLHRPAHNQRLSAMIAGNHLIHTASYQNLTEAKSIIEKFLNNI